MRFVQVVDTSRHNEKVPGVIFRGDGTVAVSVKVSLFSLDASSGLNPPGLAFFAPSMLLLRVLCMNTAVCIAYICLCGCFLFFF